MRTIIFTLALVAMSASAWAQPVGPTTYQLSDSESKAKAEIKRGIEAAVKDMNFVTRPIARGKLEKSNTAFKTLTINITPASVSVQNDRLRPIVTKGQPVDWTRDDGEKFKVTQDVGTGELVQKYTSEDGSKVLTYKFLDDNKKVQVDIVVTSDRLPGPLKYTLNYEVKP